MKKAAGVILLILSSCPSYSFEFKGEASGNKRPLEIQADHGITCNQETNICEAKGNVILSQGGAVLKADTVIAHLIKIDEAHKSLARVESQGHISLETVGESRSLLADKGYYDVQKGIMEFSGQPVRLQMGKSWIQAEHVRYYESTQIVTAWGNAMAFKDGNTLTAPILKAVLKRGAAHQLVLHEIKAEGGVKKGPTPVQSISSNRIKILLNAP